MKSSATPAPSELALELKGLHDADCFLRTHNSKCDCDKGATIDRAVTVTANYFQRQVNLFTSRIHSQALADAIKQTI